MSACMLIWSILLAAISATEQQMETQDIAVYTKSLVNNNHNIKYTTYAKKKYSDDIFLKALFKLKNPSQL